MKIFYYWMRSSVHYGTSTMDISTMDISIMDVKFMLVSTYIAELRSLAEYWNFEGTLEVMPKDRLVCGINDEQIQRRLLSEETLIVKKVSRNWRQLQRI